MLDISEQTDITGLIENKPLCERCSKPFEPRSGSGGKPQRFCSPECRTASHYEPQRGQRSPTCSGSNLPAVIETPAKENEPADAADHCWAVPSQDRIECSATNDDEVEIEQLSPIHPDENVRVHLARSNVVRLARSILFAAGFKSVLIATLDGGGGYSDVEDGDLPEHFRDAGHV